VSVCVMVRCVCVRESDGQVCVCVRESDGQVCV